MTVINLNRKSWRKKFRYPIFKVRMARFMKERKPPPATCLRPSRIAESAGVRVSALKAEMETEKAMVSANCRNRIPVVPGNRDRKSTRLNSSHGYISYAVFCLKKKTNNAG